MSDQDDYAAFQAWKAANGPAPEKDKQSKTEELKNWLEGVARHLSHPLPQAVVDDLDEQIANEKGTKTESLTPEDVEEVPAEEVEKLPTQ